MRRWPGPARRLLEVGQQGVAAARDLAEGRPGSLAVGTLATVATWVLPPAVARWHEARPDVQLRIDEFVRRRYLERAVIDGVVDLGVGVPDASFSGWVAPDRLGALRRGRAAGAAAPARPHRSACPGWPTSRGCCSTPTTGCTGTSARRAPRPASSPDRPCRPGRSTPRSSWRPPAWASPSPRSTRCRPSCAGPAWPSGPRCASQLSAFGTHAPTPEVSSFVDLLEPAVTGLDRL